jgi:hypothetical protein|tara:strand:- start:508 stop:729 length:222 start_codon:yes stop_codon:yes gene_type:complete
MAKMICLVTWMKAKEYIQAMTEPTSKLKKKFKRQGPPFGVGWPLRPIIGPSRERTEMRLEIPCEYGTNKPHVR